MVQATVKRKRNVIHPQTAATTATISIHNNIKGEFNFHTTRIIIMDVVDVTLIDDKVLWHTLRKKNIGFNTWKGKNL
jgi:hypothetical protein